MIAAVVAPSCNLFALPTGVHRSAGRFISSNLKTRFTGRDRSFVGSEERNIMSWVGVEKCGLGTERFYNCDFCVK